MFCFCFPAIGPELKNFGGKVRGLSPCVCVCVCSSHPVIVTSTCDGTDLITSFVGCAALGK
jgi:hypothetical protein